jgi:ParB family chromosome partitioning protein
MRSIQGVRISDTIMEVELTSLVEPSWLLRRVDPKIVSELARSIGNTGLLQPIVVRKEHRGYEVIFGNHRVQACRTLGMKTISAIVNHFTDDEAFLARVSENLLRNTDVDPIEEAKGYKMLVDHGWTINAIGSKVGKCDSYISERLAFIDRLTERVRSKISEGNPHLTPSHAELLSRIRDPDRQNEVAELVEKKRLSVRALEGILKGSALPKKVPIEGTAGEHYVKIPNEFSAAMELSQGQYLHMYVRGRKLILENVNAPKNNSQEIRQSYRISHVRNRLMTRKGCLK